MPAMAGTVEQDDRTTHRMSEEDRASYSERVAEHADVVRACFEAPRACVAPVRPSVPTQIEVDNLGMLGERGRSPA